MVIGENTSDEKREAMAAEIEADIREQRQTEWQP